ncbi:hypothetical protein K0M31_015611 [Melipona bicolor]|uniref:Uncharacterized protein n=1 Tax=Melipona bicolor TaxID=60889 RepID=A0AA40FFA8_9HYME|nr:hypothetical protein K0M31_015611 [Melipona bicolor]
MLGSWGWEEELELGEGTATPSQDRQRRESPDSTHPVPDSRVLRYAPSRCHHPPSFNSPHFSTQPPLDCTDCEARKKKEEEEEEALRKRSFVNSMLTLIRRAA